MLASAGAAAWVVPEILTAKPAAGATMSGNNSGGGGTTGGTPKPVTTPAATGSTGSTGSNGGSGSTPATLTSSTSPSGSGSLAQTGINIQRDAEIGAALIAGGWAMHHWASRGMPKPAAEGAAGAGAHEAGSPDEAI